MEVDIEQEENNSYSTITSLFQDDPVYLKILIELLQSYSINAIELISCLEKLILNKNAGKKIIKDSSDYRVSKTDLPDYTENIFEYTPPEKNLPVTSLTETTIVEMLTQACTDPKKHIYDDKKIAKPFQKNKLGTSLLDYPEFTLPMRLKIINSLSQLTVQQKLKYNIGFKGMAQETKDTINPNVIEPLIQLGANPAPFLYDAINHLAKYNSQKQPQHNDEFNYQQISDCEECDLYYSVISAAFKKWPLYSAKILAQFATTTKHSCSANVSIAVVKAYRLLQQTVENNRYIVSTCIKNPEKLALLLAYGIQLYKSNGEECIKKYPSQKSLEQKAIEIGNVKTLMLLKKAGANFSDLTLIDTAIQSGSHLCLKFILNHLQGKLPEDPGFYLDQLPKPPIKYSVANKMGIEYWEYANKVYKKILQSHKSRNATELEKFIIDNNPTEIKEKFNACKSILADIITSTKHNIYKAIDELSSKKTLNVLLKNPVLLTNFTNRLEQSHYVRYYNNEDLFNLYTKTSPKICSVFSDDYGNLNSELLYFGTFCGYMFYRLNPLQKNTFIFHKVVANAFLVGLGLSGVNIFGNMRMYYKKEKDYDKNNKKDISTVTKLTYLQGFLQGLQQKEQEKNDTKQNQIKLKKEKYEKKFYSYKLCKLWPKVIPKIANKIGIAFGLIAIGEVICRNWEELYLPCIVCELCFLYFMSQETFNKKNKYPSLKKLRNLCKQHGIQDGLARVQEFKLKHESLPK